MQKDLFEAAQLLGPPAYAHRAAAIPLSKQCANRLHCSLRPKVKFEQTHLDLFNVPFLMTPDSIEG